MNYMNQDLVRSRMQDLAREAQRESRVREAYRHGQPAVARSERPSSWSAVRRYSAVMTSAIFGFGA
jgi:hypothetical protein